MANSVGRPLKFKTAKELQDKLDQYFAECDLNNQPYTITGLCLLLDCDKETIRDYKHKDEYSVSVKKAYMKCENYAERQCFIAKNPGGPIFALKNYGWTDKQELDIKTSDISLVPPPKPE